MDHVDQHPTPLDVHRHALHLTAGCYHALSSMLLPLLIAFVDRHRARGPPFPPIVERTLEGLSRSGLRMQLQFMRDHWWSHFHSSAPPPMISDVRLLLYLQNQIYHTSSVQLALYQHGIDAIERVLTIVSDDNDTMQEARAIKQQLLGASLSQTRSIGVQCLVDPSTTITDEQVSELLRSVRALEVLATNGGQDRTVEAVRLLTEAIDQQPRPSQLAKILITRGEIYLRAGQKDLAFQDASAAMELKTSSKRGVVRLAAIFEALGMREEAIKAFDSGLEAFPGSRTMQAGKMLMVQLKGKSEQSSEDQLVLDVSEALEGIYQSVLPNGSFQGAHAPHQNPESLGTVRQLHMCRHSQDIMPQEAAQESSESVPGASIATTSSSTTTLELTEDDIPSTSPDEAAMNQQPCTAENQVATKAQTDLAQRDAASTTEDERPVSSGRAINDAGALAAVKSKVKRTVKQVKNALASGDAAGAELKASVALELLDDAEQTGLVVCPGHRVTLYKHRALSRLQQYKFRAAIQDARLGLNASPDWMAGNVILCDALILVQEWDEALEACERILENDQNNEAATVRHKEIMKALGRCPNLEAGGMKTVSEYKRHDGTKDGKNMEGVLTSGRQSDQVADLSPKQEAGVITASHDSSQEESERSSASLEMAQTKSSAPPSQPAELPSADVGSSSAEEKPDAERSNRDNEEGSEQGEHATPMVPNQIHSTNDELQHEASNGSKARLESESLALHIARQKIASRDFASAVHWLSQHLTYPLDNESQAEALLLRVQCNTELGLPWDVLRDAPTVLRLDPYCTKIPRFVALAYVEIGCPADALQVCSTYLELFPQDAELLALQAKLQ